MREQAEAGDFMLQAAKKDKESVQILLNAKTEVIGTYVGDLVPLVVYPAMY